MFPLFDKKKSNVTIVTTKQELKAAIQRKDENIEIRGNLAKELMWLKKLSPQKIMLLTTLLGSTVISNPLSSLAFASVAKITGMEVATIILASTVPISVILGIFKGYSIEVEAGNGVIRLKLIPKNR